MHRCLTDLHDEGHEWRALRRDVRADLHRFMGGISKVLQLSWKLQLGDTHAEGTGNPRLQSTCYLS